MANNIKLSKYGYDISVNFLTKNKSESIASERILSVIINSEYVGNKIQPSIYLTISVNTKLYNEIINQRGKAKFVIKNLKYNYEAGSISKKKYFNKEFDYIINTDTYAVGNKDNKNTEIRDDDYRKVYIGLYSNQVINNNKREIINGIITGNTISIVHNYTSHMNMLIENFDDNSTRTIAVPCIDSVSELLKYLNDVSSFYTSPYIYFHDFNYTYLLSGRGKYIKGKDNSYGTFKFNIQDINSDNKEGGMILQNNMYIINVVDSNIDIIPDNISSNKIDNITTMSPSGIIRTTKISSGKKSTFIRLNHNNTNYGNLIKSKINNSKIKVVITKDDLDASVITPNKEYNIVAKKSLKAIEGKYQLIAKREVYVRDNEKFKCSVSITLQKISS